MSERPDLLIFDCDGVLVDTEPLADTVLAKALGEAGLKMSAAEAHGAFVGLTMSDVVRLVGERHGVSLPADFLARFNARLASAFRHGVAPMPGIEEALERLPGAKCVASNGEPEKMRLSLGLAGLLPAFEGRLFSASQVGRGKPAPDLFLYAARQMGARPGACLVIEDSLPGVEAALAAGMKVIGYASPGGPNRGQSGGLTIASAKVVTDLRALPELILG